MNETTHFADIVLNQIQRKIQAPTRPPTGDTVFALAQNNCTVREPCGVCGESHKDAESPAWIFSQSGALCESCAAKLVPVLNAATRDLATLHWLGLEEGLVNIACSQLTAPSSIDWANPPDHAELLELLDSVPVRARINELRRLEAEKEARSKTLQAARGFSMDRDTFPF